MILKNKRILVTGAGGFIGSHLVEKLVELGCDVSCFVRYNSRNDWEFIEILDPNVKKKINIIPGDIRDMDAVEQAVRNIDVIFHLAALIAIPYSYIHPRETIETNILGTLNVLTSARNNGIKKLVHTSTSEVYGTAMYTPINEKHPLQGQSPYSASKIGADKIAESFYLSYDTPVATIRPFNTYGPRQSARAVTSTIIVQALKGKVFLGSTHPTRDFTYIDDIVNAFIKIAESKKAVGEVVNVGSNYEISIGDWAKKIVSILSNLNGKKKIDILFDKERVRPEKSEVNRLVCDNRKAKKMLSWEPKTPPQIGIEKTIKWISENIDMYKADLYNI